MHKLLELHTQYLVEDLVVRDKGPALSLACSVRWSKFPTKLKGQVEKKQTAREEFQEITAPDHMDSMVVIYSTCSGFMDSQVIIDDGTQGPYNWSVVHCSYSKMNG
ncbi:unnamed protein product [Caretta caretta]